MSALGSTIVSGHRTGLWRVSGGRSGSDKLIMGQGALKWAACRGCGSILKPPGRGQCNLGPQAWPVQDEVGWRGSGGQITGSLGHIPVGRDHQTRRREGMVAESISSGHRLPGILDLESQLCHVLAVCLWASYLTTLYLSFLTCEMLVIIVPALEGWF